MLVPLFTQDAFTATARRFLVSAAQPVAVSDLATAEFASVISRLVRTHDIDAGDAQRVFAALDAWKVAGPRTIEIQPGDFAAAEAMMRRLQGALRTPDALHAAAVRRTGTQLVTFDKRLARDAASLGIPVTEPA